MLNTSYLFLVLLFVYACGFTEPQQRYKPIKTIDVNVSNSTQSGEDENTNSSNGNSRNGTAGNNDESNNVNNNNDSDANGEQDESDAENEQDEANADDEQNEADAKAKEEADAKAKEEADAKAKEEADAKAKEEADAKAKEEADAKAAEEAALALIQKGQTLYEDNCNQCHPGNDLASDPRLAGKDQQAIDAAQANIAIHQQVNLQDGDTAAIAAAIAALEN